MRLHKTARCVTPSLLLILLSTSANALKIFERLSFGHLLPLLPAGELDLPNWSIVPSDPYPIINEDKITLTYGWEGNKKAGLWTTEPLMSDTWMLDMEFKASGDVQAEGGSLQLWLVKERPEWPNDLDNVYESEGFEGLGVLIDQFGGQGGSVRGFLNDGTINFKSKSVIDPMAFGHCYYPYRNLGFSSRLSVRQNDFKIEVVIDDHHCFSTDQIKIPKGYHFGVVAVTSATPDEFEVHRFVVNDGKIDVPDLAAVRKMVAKLPRHRDPSDPLPLPVGPPQKREEMGSKNNKKEYPVGEPPKPEAKAEPPSPVDDHPDPPAPRPIEDDVYPRPPTFEHDIPAANRPPPADGPGDHSESEPGEHHAAQQHDSRDTPAQHNAGHEATELHGDEGHRAAEKVKQILNDPDHDATDELLNQLTFLGDKLDFLHSEVASIEQRVGGAVQSSGKAGSVNSLVDQLSFMARRIEHIEGIVMQVQKEIEGRDYKSNLDALHDTLRTTQKFIGSDLHDNMASLVHGSAPRMGWFLFIIIGSQVLLAAGYLAYKRKRSKSPNKLL